MKWITKYKTKRLNHWLFQTRKNILYNIIMRGWTREMFIDNFQHNRKEYQKYFDLLMQIYDDCILEIEKYQQKGLNELHPNNFSN